MVDVQFMKSIIRLQVVCYHFEGFPAWNVDCPFSPRDRGQNVADRPDEGADSTIFYGVSENTQSEGFATTNDTNFTNEYAQEFV